MTDADNSTDAMGGWTKNTQKPDNPSGSVVSTMFCKAKSAKKNFFWRGDFRPLPNKNFQLLDHFFPFLFPKNSESLKILDIRLQEMGAKRLLNGTSKVRKKRAKNFFCTAILDNFQTKMFISETTSLHYFSPRIPNL